MSLYSSIVSVFIVTHNCSINHNQVQIVELQTVSSVSCSRHGDLVCGICECYHSFFGESCQCNSTGVDTTGRVLNCP